MSLGSSLHIWKEGEVMTEVNKDVLEVIEGLKAQNEILVQEIQKLKDNQTPGGQEMLMVMKEFMDSREKTNSHIAKKGLSPLKVRMQWQERQRYYDTMMHYISAGTPEQKMKAQEWFNENGFVPYKWDATKVDRYGKSWSYVDDNLEFVFFEDMVTYIPKRTEQYLNDNVFNKKKMLRNVSQVNQTARHMSEEEVYAMDKKFEQD